MSAPWITPQTIAALAELGGLRAQAHRYVFERRSFTPSVGTTGILTRIASVRMPQNTLTLLDANRPITLLVRGHVHVVAAGGAPEVIDLSGSFPAGIAQYPPGAALASQSGVIVTVNGAVVAPAAISYAPPASVSVATAVGDSVDVYALGLDGHLQLYAVPPGAVARPFILDASPFARLHSINQADALYAPEISSPHEQLPLPPNWTLQLWSQSVAVPDLSADHGGVLHLRAQRMPANPPDRGALDAFVETAFYR